MSQGVPALHNDLCLLRQNLDLPPEGAMPPQLESAQEFFFFFLPHKLEVLQEPLTTYLDTAWEQRKKQSPFRNGDPYTPKQLSGLNPEPSARREQRNPGS